VILAIVAFEGTGLPRPEQARRRAVGWPGRVLGKITCSEPIWRTRRRARHHPWHRRPNASLRLSPPPASQRK